jgi:uncharacterized protein (TIGR02453 family)
MAEAKEGFRGFPPDMLRFYQELARNNRREWFEAARARYSASVVGPAQRFVHELGTRLRSTEKRLLFDAERLNGQGSILRIQRDVRFSADKRPYKTNLGLLFWLDDGRAKKLCPHFYVGIDPQALHLYAGLHGLPPALLLKFRSALLHPRHGRQLETILRALEAEGYSTGGERFKRVPAPFDQGHPLARLLRYDGVYVERRLPPREATLAGLTSRCAETFQQVLPLLRWISGALGGG